MIRNDKGDAALIPKIRYETILLIEADGVSGRMLANALRLYGYYVLLAGDGDEAISICNRHLGRIDVVVINLLNPGMDACELARQLTATRPRLKVLYISGDSDDLIAGNRPDESAVVRKPFTPSQLAVAIQQTFEPVACIA